MGEHLPLVSANNTQAPANSAMIGKPKDHNTLPQSPKPVRVDMTDSQWHC